MTSRELMFWPAGKISPHEPTGPLAKSVAGCARTPERGEIIYGQFSGRPARKLFANFRRDQPARQITTCSHPALLSTNNSIFSATRFFYRCSLLSPPPLWCGATRFTCQRPMFDYLVAFDRRTAGRPQIFPSRSVWRQIFSPLTGLPTKFYALGSQSARQPLGQGAGLFIIRPIFPAG